MLYPVSVKASGPECAGLRAEPVSPACSPARLLATEQLRDWGLPLDPMAHIVADLAANAVTHGRVPGRDFRLTLYVVGDTLRIEVTDTRGERAPQAQHPAADAESGRGLLIVDALADRWGTSEGPAPRKTVWAEVALPSTSPPKPSPLSSGDMGGLSQEPLARKNPHQAPPLPPAAQTHSRE